MLPTAKAQMSSVFITHLVVIGMMASVAGCDPDVTVCELPDNLNTCESNSDCILVRCLVECCSCERPASREQYEETYCMVNVSDPDDYVIARERCEEARDCDDVDCTAVPCPFVERAVCDNGICVIPES